MARGRPARTPPPERTLGPAEREAAVLGMCGYARTLAVRWVARNPGRVAAVDLYQAAMLGICMAARTFDTGRGIRFITYAGYYAEQEIRLLLHDAAGGGTRRRGSTGRIFYTTQTGYVGAIPDHRAAAADGDLWEWAESVLPARQFAAVASYYRDGRTAVDTAAMLGVSPQRAAQVIEAGLAKLRAAWR